MIKCPNCGHNYTLSIGTRMSTRNRVKRRKECQTCGYRFTTYEVYEGDIDEHAFDRGRKGQKWVTNTAEDVNTSTD